MRKIRLDDSCLNHLTNIPVGFTRKSSYIHTSTFWEITYQKYYVFCWQGVRTHLTQLVSLRQWMNTYQLVLISSDGSERSLREDEGPELTLVDVLKSSNRCLCSTAADHVNTRLILVHRIQNYLYTTCDDLRLYFIRHCVGYDSRCNAYNSHRRHGRDETRQFCLVRVGGVNYEMATRQDSSQQSSIYFSDWSVAKWKLRPDKTKLSCLVRVDGVK